MGVLMLLVMLLPMLGGLLQRFLPFRHRRHREALLLVVLTLNAVLVVWLALCGRHDSSDVPLHFGTTLTITFRMDGPATVFCCLAALLWPLSTLYAFPYMRFLRKKLKRTRQSEQTFFLFYAATEGIVLGLGMSGNLLTMYLFFEALSLITTPLIVYTFEERAMSAGRRYLRYMLGGAAFGFIALVFLLYSGDADSFRYGGSFRSVLSVVRRDWYLVVYVLAFFGFAVKAALFPFGRWLISATAAPTPVTALLHAAAVVNSGAFAVFRLTYYCYGTEYLSGSYAQVIVMAAAALTVLYGSTMAVKETHLKRRLAYSTMSNLSYILFGITVMTPLGAAASLLHLVAHAVMKLCSFFCIGIVMQRAHRNYVYEMDGIGKQLPFIMGCFCVAACGLTGIPPFIGFYSKWRLATAAVESGNQVAAVLSAVLPYAALMTAFFLFPIGIRAFFIKASAKNGKQNERLSVPLGMWLPILIFAAATLILGLCSSLLFQFILTHL